MIFVTRVADINIALAQLSGVVRGNESYVHNLFGVRYVMFNAHMYDSIV